MNSSRLRKMVVRQFGHPTGTLGKLAGIIMSRRTSNRERNNRTLDLLDLQSNDRVLEIGFGPGIALEKVARLVSGGQVVGIDHSEVMVAQAAKRNSIAIAAGRMELHQASAGDPPTFGRAFDKVFAVNVHMFWSDPVRILRGVRDLLVPGGTIALTFQPRKAHATNEDARHGGEEIMQHLRAAGFVEARTELLEMKPVNAVCVLAAAPGEPE